MGWGAVRWGAVGCCRGGVSLDEQEDMWQEKAQVEHGSRGGRHKKRQAQVEAGTSRGRHKKRQHSMLLRGQESMLSRGKHNKFMCTQYTIHTTHHTRTQARAHAHAHTHTRGWREEEKLTYRSWGPYMGHGTCLKPVTCLLNIMCPRPLDIQPP